MALLDLLVEGVPSPAKRGSPIEVDGSGAAAFVFKTIADPFAGRISLFRVLKGPVKADSTLANVRAHAKERLGQLLLLQGKEHTAEGEFAEGDIGAVAKLKETQTGDLLLESERAVELPKIDFPEPVMSFAVTPKAKGDEDKAAASLRRLAEEDPTLILRRDERTGEQLLAGLSQMHVEVAVDRLHSALRRRRRSRPAARPVPRDDPHRVACAGAIQEADGWPRAVRRLRDRARAASRARGLRVR